MAPDAALPPELPLLDLFTRLRQDFALPIGVDDYLLALAALSGGFGLADRAALEAMLAVLWTTSAEEARLLRQVLGDLLAAHATHRDAPVAPAPAPAPAPPPTPDGPAPASASATAAPQTTPPPTAGPPVATGGALDALQVVRGAAGAEGDLVRVRYPLLGEYLPVTRRQMKQSWRHLRRTVREGPPVELDLPATVERIGREGVFREPVLRPRRRNQANLALLIDQDGSMVPFHALSRQLLATAERGGRLGGVYYFHDYPEGSLYRDAARLDAVPVAEALATLGERTPVLIVGDAGAARGRLDPDRVAGTHRFLALLQGAVRYFAWLNPMPVARWPNSSAAGIAQRVPMFELSRPGLDAAIGTLRGRYQPAETLYPWMH